jgi:hypothetical protein
LRLHTGRAAQPANPPAGHQIFKFSPDGKLLMTLGKAAWRGYATDSGFFYQPNDVLVAPNGEIYVPRAIRRPRGLWRGSEVLEGREAPRRRGASSGAARTISTSLMRSPWTRVVGLFVGDRGNNRIKIFDQSGKLLDTWYPVQPAEWHLHRSSGPDLCCRLRVRLGGEEADGLEARHSDRQREGREGDRIHS